jgi:hypothetical protein
MEESTGGTTAQTIADFLSEELVECEWVSRVSPGDGYDEPWFRVTTDEGDTFQVVVKKV